MATITPLTWMDYEGPTHTYLCRDCGKVLIDESTADHADEFDTLRDEHLTAMRYVSLRCPSFPECMFWEASCQELKDLNDRIYETYKQKRDYV
jgi:hypothetical protein